jgi:plasmid stabilization system protein ParE
MELHVPPVYEVNDGEVQVLRLLHGAQEWPAS